MQKLIPVAIIQAIGAALILCAVLFLGGNRELFWTLFSVLVIAKAGAPMFSLRPINTRQPLH